MGMLVTIQVMGLSCGFFSTGRYCVCLFSMSVSFQLKSQNGSEWSSGDRWRGFTSASVAYGLCDFKQFTCLCVAARPNCDNTHKNL